MEETSNSRHSNSTAKIILISTGVTIVTIFTVLYISRGLLLSYIFHELEPQFSQQTSTVEKTATNEDLVIAAISKVNPAVVSVIVTKDVPVYERYFETFEPWGSFGSFSIPRVREKGTEEQEVGGGSGFIVSSDGLLVTNRHVVDDDMARYSIVLENGDTYEVDVVDKDEQLDIAILKISTVPNQKLPFVQFGDSKSIKLGQTVIAIGNVLAEFQNSVSVGVVSGVSRSVVASNNQGELELLNQVIQTDAAINPGNSGGPLLNLSGEVIGVNVAASRGADNIGFALPSHIIEQVVDSVREYGEIVRPFLGIQYVMIDESVQKSTGINESYGALVVGGAEGATIIEPNSPAGVANLQIGDVIIAIDGEFLFQKDLASVLREKEVGQTIELTILRNGGEQSLSVVLDRAL